MVEAPEIVITKDDRLLTIRATAARLGCEKRQVYNLLDEKYLIGHYPNGRGRRPARVLERSVINYIKAFLLPTDGF